MMKRIGLSVLAAGLFLVGCSNSESDFVETETEEQEAVAQPTDFEAVADNLVIPWDINKIGDIFYLSERQGSITKVENGQQIRQPVIFEKQVASSVSEAGFLGFILAPDFAETGRAYGYYTYQNGGQFNRVVELRLEGNEWRETKVLLDQIPSDTVHHGGRLELGPDGKLYATAGDAAQPELAQNLDSLAGKILRLNLDGSIPEDNPFPSSYVYSYGHRNPQGLAWAEDGTMNATEHGPNAQDEINVIKPGKNYGWPEITGENTKQGMETPLFNSGTDTWAPSGMAIYGDKLYVATLRGNAVREFDLQTIETREVVTGLGRIRDVWIEEDVLYFVSNNTDGRGTPLTEDDKLYKMLLSS